MIETLVLAVLNPLVSKLTEDFLTRRRNTVHIADLQDQVVRLMASHLQLEEEVTQTRLSVIALTRYLARTQAEVFVLKGDFLQLVTVAPNQRQVLIGHAIQDFSSGVEARLQERLGRSEQTTQQSKSQLSRSTQPDSTRATGGNNAASSSEALNKFFDGFEEEIMRARLGHGGSND
jgi:hypothetical protein